MGLASVAHPQERECRSWAVLTREKAPVSISRPGTRGGIVVADAVMLPAVVTR